MACSKEYIEFVCARLSGIGVIRPKKMFGDWLIYIDEKPIVMACDNTCYVKMLPEITGMMAGALTAPPYPGAKPHYILDIEHRDIALNVVKMLLSITPYPKKRSKK